MALATLGLFVFTLKTIPFQEMDEQRTWKHQSQAAVGAQNPPTQFTGKENDKITLSCELRPEVSGGDWSIELLYKMADSGQPWPLIYGTGEFKGSYVIESIGKKQSVLLNDGKAKAISFTMGLKKVSDNALSVNGAALSLMIGMVRRLGGV